MQTQKLTKKQNEMIMRADKLYTILSYNNGRINYKNNHSPFLNGDIEINIFINEEDKMIIARLNSKCVIDSWDKNNPLIKMYGKATCSEPDIFDIRKGIRIATNKLVIQITQYIHTKSKILIRALKNKYINDSNLINNDIEFVKQINSKY